MLLLLPLASCLVLLDVCSVRGGVGSVGVHGVRVPIGLMVQVPPSVTHRLADTCALKLEIVGLCGLCLTI
jgi:hypothetical protein